MSYYKFNPDFTYKDFLKQKKFIHSEGFRSSRVFLEVHRQILELVADENSLAQYDIEILDSYPGLSTEIKSDSVLLAYHTCDEQNTTAELIPKFHWGLADCIATIGHMHENLNLLIEKLDSPVQILAYNHFEKAREAFKAKQYSFALEEINKAINGDQTSSGFQAEWRFYILQGVIYLGFYDSDIELVDLEKAEDAFTHAALFAQAEYRSASALAYMTAGWAVYCQGKIAQAIEYTKKALDQDPKLYEADFLMAKYHLASGNVPTAFEFLTSAIRFDVFYALKAAGDNDFHEHSDKFKEYLVDLKHTQFERFRKRVTDEMNQMKSQAIPPGLKEVIDKFSDNKPLLELTITETEWNQFKVKPIFVSKKNETLKIEHETMIQVMEPYREKVIIKPKTWLRKEESKIVTKTRVVDKKKKTRYNIEIFKDIFMFFTGKIVVEYEMVLVPGGKYDMGDTLNVGRSDEKPIQRVELSSYLICRTQVNQKLWNMVMNQNPSNFQGFELPVDHVSWYECIEFCNKLSNLAGFTPYYTIDKDKPDSANLTKSDGRKLEITCNQNADGYRMLTEAEWEFAAKGGSNSNHYKFAGSETETKVAWSKNDSGFKTHPVAQKKPNELGLYDMSGNVWEWCWDWYDDYSEKDYINPQGAEKGSYKVIRGGSWADNKNYHRVASRGKENPSGKYSSIGLRIGRNYFEQNSQ